MNEQNPSILEIENLNFAYGKRKILDSLNLQLKKGQFATVIGPSGSGKTTLFKLLTGILACQSGMITINSYPSPTAYHQVSYMMQDDLMLPWRTVLENLMLVGELGPSSSIAQAKMRIEALFFLQEMGLENWQDHYPHELSGGMRQRVALARVLLQKRPLLLLDEPFASLDVSLKEQMHKLLRNIRQKYGTTMLMVTHDFRDALALSDEVYLFSQGKIAKKWDIDPQVYLDRLLSLQLSDEIYQALKSSDL